MYHLLMYQKPIPMRLNQSSICSTLQNVATAAVAHKLRATTQQRPIEVAEELLVRRAAVPVMRMVAAHSYKDPPGNPR